MVWLILFSMLQL